MSDEPTIMDWTWFDPSVLEAEDQVRFLARKNAVELRLVDRKRPNAVFVATGIRPTELKALIERCRRKHADGAAYGYRGMVPDQKTSYARRAAEQRGLPDGRGKAGLFRFLMESHPANLRDYVEELFIHGERLKNRSYSLLTFDEIFERFLTRCRLLLLKGGETADEQPYPLSTTDQGRRSLQRWLNGIAARDPEHFIRRSNGDDAATSFRSDSSGAPHILKSKRLLEGIQFDGHRIDADGVASVPQPSGMPHLVLLSDLFTLDWIDTCKSIPFGHHLALTGSYNRYDVLRSLAAGIGVLRSTEGLQKYLPVHFVPELEWACFDRMDFDRALAHIADEVMEALEDTFNCEVSVDEAGTPKKRGHIERMFRALEARGISRLPSAYRPGGNKVKRELAMKRAMAHQIDWFDIDEMIKRAIRDEILEGKRRFEGRSAVDFIKYLIARNPNYFRRTPRELRFRRNLLRVKVVARVTAARDGKSRARCYAIWGDYRGDLLSASLDHVGKELFLEGDCDDVRVLDAYDGTKWLDRVHAQRPWADSPHSFETRCRAMKLFRELRINATSLHDGVAKYREMLYERATKAPTPRLAKEVARIDRESGANDRVGPVPAREAQQDDPRDRVLVPATTGPRRKAINFF